MKQKLTQERLKKLLHYDSRTGIFTWKVSRGGVKIGDVAGSNSEGYIQIGIYKRIEKAHRLAWLYMEGYWPKNIEIDHRDRNPSNNKFQNLRLSSRQCNIRNSKISTRNISGVVGVNKDPRDKWRAQIKITEKKVFLGRFVDFIDAVRARWAAEVKYNFPNCNTTSTAYLYLKGGTNEKIT